MFCIAKNKTENAQKAFNQIKHRKRGRHFKILQTNTKKRSQAIDNNNN